MLKSRVRRFAGKGWKTQLNPSQAKLKIPARLFASAGHRTVNAARGCVGGRRVKVARKRLSAWSLDVVCATGQLAGAMIR